MTVCAWSNPRLLLGQLNIGTYDTQTLRGNGGEQSKGTGHGGTVSCRGICVCVGVSDFKKLQARQQATAAHAGTLFSHWQLMRLAKGGCELASPGLPPAATNTMHARCCPHSGAKEKVRA